MNTNTTQSAGVQQTGFLRALAIIEVVCAVRRCTTVLVEGGPQLLRDFFSNV